MVVEERAKRAIRRDPSRNHTIQWFRDGLVPRPPQPPSGPRPQPLGRSSACGSRRSTSSTGRAPTESSVDEERYADAIASLDADVLALQEVDRNQPRSGGADLTALAAEAMGAVAHRFEPALWGTPGSWSPTRRHTARRPGVRRGPAQPLPGARVAGLPAAADPDAVAVPAQGPHALGVGARGTARRPARRAGDTPRPDARGHHPPLVPPVVQRPPAAFSRTTGRAVRCADRPPRRPEPASTSGHQDHRDAAGREWTHVPVGRPDRSARPHPGEGTASCRDRRASGAAGVGPPGARRRPAETVGRPRPRPSRSARRSAA